MVNVDYDSNFRRIYEKLDKSIKDRVEKLIVKIINNPEIGKPMRYVRKDTREVYFKPFRLSYAYIVNKNKIIFLDLYHQKNK